MKTTNARFVEKITNEIRASPMKNTKSLFAKFPDNESARLWFEQVVWSGTPVCPRCNSFKHAGKSTHHNMQYRCFKCGRHFGIRSCTPMKHSKIGYQKYAIALYMIFCHDSMTSTRLHKILRIRQASAWFLMDRIKKTFRME